MDNKEKAVINVRKLQEEGANLTNAGLQNEIAKWDKTLFDAYCKVGFTIEQALELVKERMKSK